MLPREYTLSQYDSGPPLTACKILVILIDSSFVEQVEEYNCLNTDYTITPPMRFRIYRKNY